MPDEPLVPEEPDEPEVPELPEVPDEPLEPEVPDEPLEPEVPEDPEVPDEPLVPSAPAVVVITLLLPSSAKNVVLAPEDKPVNCAFEDVNSLTIVGPFTIRDPVI